MSRAEKVRLASDRANRECVIVLFRTHRAHRGDLMGDASRAMVACAGHHVASIAMRDDIDPLGGSIADTLEQLRELLHEEGWRGSVVAPFLDDVEAAAYREVRRRLDV